MSATVTEAVEHADWYARYALDRLNGTEHPGLRGHLLASEVQLQAAMKLAAQPVST